MCIMGPIIFWYNNVIMLKWSLIIFRDVFTLEEWMPVKDACQANELSMEAGRIGPLLKSRAMWRANIREG